LEVTFIELRQGYIAKEGKENDEGKVRKIIHFPEYEEIIFLKDLRSFREWQRVKIQKNTMTEKMSFVKVI